MMSERNKDLDKLGVKFLYNLYNPDGSPQMEINPETGEQSILRRWLNPGEVKMFRGMGYEVRPVVKEVGIDKSQTRHDKGEDEE